MKVHQDQSQTMELSKPASSSEPEMQHDVGEASRASMCSTESIPAGMPIDGVSVQPHTSSKETNYQKPKVTSEPEFEETGEPSSPSIQITNRANHEDSNPISSKKMDLPSGYQTPDNKYPDVHHAVPKAPLDLLDKEPSLYLPTPSISSDSMSSEKSGASEGSADWEGFEELECVDSRFRIGPVFPLIVLDRSIRPNRRIRKKTIKRKVYNGVTEEWETDGEMTDPKYPYTPSLMVKQPRKWLKRKLYHQVAQSWKTDSWMSGLSHDDTYTQMAVDGREHYEKGCGSSRYPSLEESAQVQVYRAKEALPKKLSGQSIGGYNMHAPCKVGSSAMSTEFNLWRGRRSLDMACIQHRRYHPYGHDSQGPPLIFVASPWGICIVFDGIDLSTLLADFDYIVRALCHIRILGYSPDTITSKHRDCGIFDLSKRWLDLIEMENEALLLTTELSKLAGPTEYHTFRSQTGISTSSGYIKMYFSWVRFLANAAVFHRAYKFSWSKGSRDLTAKIYWWLDQFT